ncbi:hypothetical protein PMIT1313_00556 [Prochlorococcus marinus str. MIT 1313]|nr:hypothetical protein PMIT1313_00556 [Prochlorococcus marinus str. MIT 1313]
MYGVVNTSIYEENDGLRYLLMRTLLESHDVILVGQIAVFMAYKLPVNILRQ